MLGPRHILDVKKQQIEVSLKELFEDVISTIRAAVSCLSTRKPDPCQGIIANDVNINKNAASSSRIVWWRSHRNSP